MDATPTPAPPAPPEEPIPWPRSAQVALAVLLTTALVLLAINVYGYLPWACGHCSSNAARPWRLRFNLNHADRAELLQIPGLGPQLVERLEAYRRDHGGFHNVEELTRVRGIGPATLTRMRSWVYVNAAAEDDEAEVPVVSSIPKPSVPSQPVSSKKIVGLSGQVDLNTASAEELKQLPGIGPKMAKSIIETRSKEPFRSVEDLRRVRGIGVKTLERLRPHVTVPREPARSGIVAGDKDIE